ncbi:MAG: secondary thiamine-phosphate synthase enzyme YjbQ [Opitutales bacterium]|nr:secondary thiamine-phosphate synthase enzyme YjbQ [Opitutales bacterium]
MAVHHEMIHVSTRGKGTLEITSSIRECVETSGMRDGIVSVLCLHTSCSLVLMENADPSARHDLEHYMERLVPENEPYFTHIYEGADDMPSHIKMALTRSSETIPFTNQHLILGTWQGIFLWEHRSHPHSRKLAVTVVGE